MEAQGSSLSALQGRIMSLVNAIGSDNAPRGMAEDHVKTNYTDAVHAENERQKKVHEDNLLREQMMELSKKLKADIEKTRTNIDFSYTDDIKSLVVTVRDGSGNRIIREIPSQDAINLMLKMRDVVGNIFDERV